MPYWPSFDRARCLSDSVPLRPMEALDPFGCRADVREGVRSWRHGGWEAFAGPWSNHLHGIAFVHRWLFLRSTAVSAHAQMLDGSVTTASDFGARKIFLMLFLMIGPIKNSRSVCRDHTWRRSRVSSNPGEEGHLVLRRRARTCRRARPQHARKFRNLIAGARPDGRRGSVPRGPANRASAIGWHTRFRESAPLSRST